MCKIISRFVQHRYPALQRDHVVQVFYTRLAGSKRYLQQQFNARFGKDIIQMLLFFLSLGQELIHRTIIKMLPNGSKVALQLL